LKNSGINAWLKQALSSVSITNPTPVQLACIPPTLNGKDIIASAKTGSGKTLAFALPILQSLSIDPFGVYGLVLTPTRELAFQIAEQFRILGVQINLKICIVVGGMDMLAQAVELAKRPHIVIATPGRLADHVQSSLGLYISRDAGFLFDVSVLTLSRFLVLDEADRLLRQEL